MLYDSLGIPLRIEYFPNGEVSLRHVPKNLGTVTLKWQSNQDLFNLMLVKRHQFPGKETKLVILYMPYSRMDRDEDGNSCCSLRYVGEFIRNLGFAEILVVDPHSDLTLAYLGERSRAIYPFASFSDQVFEGVGDLSEAVILFPDAGAQKRYHHNELFSGHRQIVGFKNRDFMTGQITGYQISEPSAVRGKKVVIVDDLCSYGGTFLAAGKELRLFDPKEITLMVSHCEESIRKGSLLTSPYPVDHIVTTNSILDMALMDTVPGRVHMIDLLRSFLW